MAARTVTVTPLIGMSELIGQIARRNGVPVRRIPATRARIRHFRRLGFPVPVEANKGAETYFTRTEARMLNMAVAVNLAGIPPEKAIRMVTEASLAGLDLSGNKNVSFELRSDMSGEVVGLVMIRATSGPEIGYSDAPKLRSCEVGRSAAETRLGAGCTIGPVSNGFGLLGDLVAELAVGSEIADERRLMAGERASLSPLQLTGALGDDLLEGAEAAGAYIGISARKVFRMAADGHLPVIRKGRKMFFRKSDLEAAFQ